MNEYEQLQLFNLEDYASPEVVSQSDSLLFFQLRSKVMYEQLNLDLDFGLEPPNDDQSLDQPEAA